MNPSTDDTPTRVSLMPDWRQGVTLAAGFLSNVMTSRKGLEQRIRMRKRPIYFLEYRRSGLTEEEAKDRLLAIRDEFRKPLTVPMWTDGITLQTGMVSATAALLDSNPITDEWPAPFDVFIWSPEGGGEWRTCTAVAGRVLTFSGTGFLHPVGAWVFPSRLMIRDAMESSLQAIDVKSGEEIHRYRTL